MFPEPRRHRVREFLIGLNLTLVAVLLFCVNLTWLTGLRDALVYRYESQDIQFQLERCERKHQGLLTAIKREGLWKRLGLAEQPWLQ